MGVLLIMQQQLCEFEPSIFKTCNAISHYNLKPQNQVLDANSMLHARLQFLGLCNTTYKSSAIILCHERKIYNSTTLVDLQIFQWRGKLF